MMKPLVLSVDCGTQSLRVFAVDQDGHIVKGVKKAFEPYFSTHPGFAEQDPEIYWKALCSACNELFARSPELKERIKACVICTLRDSM